MSSSSVDVSGRIVLRRRRVLRGDEGRSREPASLRALFFCAGEHGFGSDDRIEVAGLRGRRSDSYTCARSVARVSSVGVIAVTRELHREDGTGIPIATSLSPMRNAPSAPTR